MTTSDSTQAPSQTPSQPAVPDKTAAASPAPAATGSAAAAPATTTTAAAPAAAPAQPKPGEAVKPADDAATKAAADKAAADAATQAATDKATADKAAADAAAAAAAEVYELAPPKGVTFSPDLVPVLGPVFKDLKLPKATGEKLVTGFMGYLKDLPAKQLARDLEATMKDPELGLLNWGKTQGTVNEALAAFTTPEFRQKLERWGIANDLEFVRVFASIGKAMRGDTAARGSPTTASEESVADRMYGRAQKVQAN